MLLICKEIGCIYYFIEYSIFVLSLLKCGLNNFVNMLILIKLKVFFEVRL